MEKRAPKMHFEPMKPVCDGILFLDSWRLKTFDDQALLAGRGLLFMTEFPPPYDMFGGDIFAANLAAAEEIAFGRGLGEKVVGPVTRVILPPRRFGPL